MFEEMTKVEKLFTRFGGHPMAAGLSMERESIEELRRRLNENCILTEEDLTPRKLYDAVLPVRYAGECPDHREKCQCAEIDPGG